MLPGDVPPDRVPNIKELDPDQGDGNGTRKPDQISNISIKRCLCAGFPYKNPSEKMPKSMIFCGLFKFKCLIAGIGNKNMMISVMMLPPALT